jgi:hypothetical protein
MSHAMACLFNLAHRIMEIFTLREKKSFSCLPFTLQSIHRTTFVLIKIVFAGFRGGAFCGDES